MFGIRVTLLGIVAVAVLIRDSDAGMYATPAETIRVYEVTTVRLFGRIDGLLRINHNVSINASVKYRACYDPQTRKTYAGLENCAKNVFNEIAPIIKCFLTETQIKISIKDQYAADMVTFGGQYRGTVFGLPMIRPFEEALANVNRTLQSWDEVYAELMQLN